MGGLELKPIPFKSLPRHLLRPFPTLFEFARLTAADAEVGSVARRRYVANLRALKAMLAVTTRGHELSSEAVEPLIHRCEAMVSLRGAELAAAFEPLMEGMQAIYEADRDAIKEAIAEDPDLYRELYRAEVKPIRVLAVYAEDTWDRSEKMGDKLVDRCWYDHWSHREGEGMVWLDAIDVVLFAPGKKSIGASIEEAVARAEIPILVLAGWIKQKDPQGMVELRLEHMYRTTGFNVLHGPFPPVRLYQIIDKLHLRHLARRDTARLRMVAAARDSQAAWDQPRFLPYSSA